MVALWPVGLRRYAGGRCAGRVDVLEVARASGGGAARSGRRYFRGGGRVPAVVRRQDCAVADDPAGTRVTNHHPVGSVVRHLETAPRVGRMAVSMQGNLTPPTRA